MSSVPLKSPNLKLYFKAIGISLIFDGPLECLRLAMKAKMHLSEENIGIVFDGIAGILFLPILYALVLLLCQEDLAQVPGKLDGRTGKNFGQHLVSSLSYWGLLIVTQLTVGLIVMVHVGIAVVPGLGINYLLGLDSPYALLPYGLIGALWGAVPLFFAPILVVVEGLSPWKARFRSRELVKTALPKAIVLVLVFVLLPEILGIFLESISNQLASIAGGGDGSDGLGGDGLRAVLRLFLGFWGVVGIVVTYWFYLQCRLKLSRMPPAQK